MDRTDKEYLLVLGAPRSGTTLLTAMIGCHDDVAMLNEDFRSAVRNLVSKRIAGNKLCVPNQIELRRRGGGVWVRRLQRRGFLTRVPESKYAIEDYLDWGSLKFITIVRNGNAVISSIMKRGRQSRTEAAYRWCRSLEVISELKTLHRDQVLVLTFEQLVACPESTMQQVAHHLEISYQSKMLEGYAYTPIYSNQGIDASKAQTEVPRDEAWDVAREYPEAYQRYAELLQAARTPVNKPSPN